MSKMHEYSGDVTVTLKRTMLCQAESEDDAAKHLKSLVTHFGSLDDFTEGNIKDIKVEDVERIQ